MQDLAAEFRRELRDVLRQRDDLLRPLNKFAYVPDRQAGQPPHYVIFDLNAHRPIRGLRTRTNRLVLPDERIIDTGYRFAESVWHLKDRLKGWIEVNGLDLDAEAHAASRPSLLVVADLANQKKHGTLNRPRSNRSPQLGVLHRNENGELIGEGSGLVRFDLSRSGVIEFFFDGARKDKVLLVTNDAPIPFTIEVLVDDGRTSLGNAADFIYSAFEEWLPLIRDASILTSGNREAAGLLTEFFPDADSVG